MVEFDAADKLTWDRAKTAELSRDFSLAEELYKNLLQKHESDTELLSALGSLYEKMNKFPEALSLYEKILAKDPQNIAALNSLGSVYRHLRQYRESISALEKGIIVDETNSQVFYNLGFTYKDLGKYTEAIQCFNLVISQNANDVLAYNHLGAIYSLQHEYEKAIPVFQRGLKIDPNHPILHLNLARAYEKTGEQDKASQEYEAALRSKPGWLDAIDGYADLLLLKSKPSQARNLVSQAVRLNPDNASMHTKLGTVYATQNEYADAEDEFNTALQLSPESTDALSGLADTYESEGKIKEALATMEKYEQLSPEDLDMLRQYTSILLSADKLQSAMRKIKQLWDKDPEDSHTLNLLGQYYICNGDEQKAQGCFAKITKLDPEYTDHLYDGARRYTQKGMHRQAEEQLQQYLAANPEDSHAISLLASNYETQERYDDALDMYRKLASRDSGNKSYMHNVERVSSAILRKEDDAASAMRQSGASQDFPAEGSVPEASPAQFSQSAVNHAVRVESVADVPLMESSSEFDFESLTKNDENVSPFEENFLDDEIMASNAEVESLDAIVADSEPIDDFFNRNPFGTESFSRSLPEREEAAPDFMSEDVGSISERDGDTIDLNDGAYIPEEEPPAPERKPAPVSRPEPETGSVADETEPVQEELPSSFEDFSDEPSSVPSDFGAEDLSEPEPAAEKEEPAAVEYTPEELGLDDLPEPDMMEDGVFEAEDAPEPAQLESLDADMDMQTDMAAYDEPDFGADDLNYPEDLKALPSEEELAPALDASEDFVAPELPDDISNPLEPELDSDFLPEEMEDVVVPVEEPSVIPVENSEDDFAVAEDFAKEIPVELDDDADVAALTGDMQDVPVLEGKPDVPDVPPASGEKMQEALAALSQIVSAINNRIAAQKLSHITNLFIMLRSLVDFLPEDSRARFLSSREHMQLEYLIARLMGKPGLFSVSETLRKELGLEDCEVCIQDGNEGLSLTKSLLSYMRPLIQNLPESGLAQALDGEVGRILESLEG